MNIAILQILPLNTVVHICCVSRYSISRVCDVVYEEEILWSGVNRTVLRMYGTNHISSNQLIYRYLSREEPVQKEERNASILRHKFQKHLLTPQFCAAVLGPRFAHEIIIFLIRKCNMQKIRLKIDSPYLEDLLKNRSFFGYISPINRQNLTVHKSF